MKQETRWAYEKRIKKLESDFTKANFERDLYRSITSDIHFAVLETLKAGGSVSIPYILTQMKRAWR